LLTQANLRAALETLTDSEVEARKLAAIHLESIGRPPSAFVRVWPTCAKRSVDYPDILDEFAPDLAREQPAKAAKAPTEDDRQAGACARCRISPIRSVRIRSGELVVRYADGLVQKCETRCVHPGPPSAVPARRLPATVTRL
jgi:hypothetical protein